MSFTDELARRMAGPQRHRLLQGYPMVPLLRQAAPPSARGFYRTLDGQLVDIGGQTIEPAHLALDGARPLIIGVLPHAQCNPRVAGCGFCTFPHDPFNKQSLVESVARVGQEIDRCFAQTPTLTNRRVEALYFGGATANLTPPAQLRALAATLAQYVTLDDAEITIEGVPSRFLSLFAGPLDALCDMPAASRRISMGLQTFDDEQLARMGRSGFGDRKTFARVVERAHKRGLTASCDLLFNLPHQTQALMLDDVRIAAELGFDQICIYHLVLHAELGTAWARDPALVAALPSTDAACDNWLALREALIGRGYAQATLTNFERTGRFLYERASFTPETYDAIGFGPLAISTLSSLRERRAVKTLRSKRQGTGGWFGPDDLWFAYDEIDLRLLHLTRSLPLLAIDRRAYSQRFAIDLAGEHADALAALAAAALVTVDDDALALTPRGMFYADAVAGLFAWQRVQSLDQSGAGRHTRDLLEEKLRLDRMG
jgi:oxygen-independent coproporphyrinogen-3 oxidase